MTVVRVRLPGRLLAFLFAIYGLTAPVHSEAVWAPDLGWIDLSRGPAPSAQGLYVHGRGLFIRGDVAAALECFTNVRSRYSATDWARRAQLEQVRCLGQLDRTREAWNAGITLLRDGQTIVPQSDIVDCLLVVVVRMGESAPQRAAGLCTELLALCADKKQRYEIARVKARLYARSGRYDLARSAHAAAAEYADGTEAGLASLFLAAEADLIASREGPHDADRLRRAQDGFRRYVAGMSSGARAERAQTYIWLIEDILREEDAARRQAFYAVTYVAEGRLKEAYPILKRAAKKYRGTAAGEAARLFQAECLDRMGKPWKAAGVYVTLLKEYPATRRRRHVVAREYAMALKLQEAGDLDKAVAVFRHVADHLPTGPLADDALIRLGDCELAQEHYRDARDAYDAVVADYSRSEWYYSAVLKGGKADLMESAYRRDNAALLARAERSLAAYVRYAPDGVDLDEARKLLADCHERQAAVAMGMARFYERQGRPLSAAACYERVVGQYPETAQAGEARRRSEELKRSESVQEN